MVLNQTSFWLDAIWHLKVFFANCFCYNMYGLELCPIGCVHVIEFDDVVSSVGGQKLIQLYGRESVFQGNPTINKSTNGKQLDVVLWRRHWLIYPAIAALSAIKKDFKICFLTVFIVSLIEFSSDWSFTKRLLQILWCHVNATDNGLPLCPLCHIFFLCVCVVYNKMYKVLFNLSIKTGKLNLFTWSCICICISPVISFLPRWKWELELHWAKRM